MTMLAGSQGWFGELGTAIGTPPDNYFVLDIETTGLDSNQDLAVQLGFCSVKDRKVVKRGSTVLNWDQYGGVDSDWFRERLQKCEREMTARGATCHMTYDRVVSTGYPPIEVLEGFVALIEEAATEGAAIVGHNHVAFDIPFLNRHLRDYLKTNWEIPLDNLWDSGLIEKARQLRLLPKPGMSRYDYFLHVRRQFAKGVKWSLDKFCVPAYQLSEKYDLNFGEAHEAGFDAYLTHLVVEEQRKLMLPATNKSREVLGCA